MYIYIPGYGGWPQDVSISKWGIGSCYILCAEFRFPVLKIAVKLVSLLSTHFQRVPKSLI